MLTHRQASGFPHDRFYDKEVCFLLDADIQDRLMAVSDDIETAVCERYIDEYRIKHGLPVKRNMEYLDM